MTASDRLRSSDVVERLAAMAELRECGRADAAAVTSLIECLGDHRKIIQRRGAETLAALGARGTAVHAPLRAALHSKAARQRWGAAYALSLVGPPEMIALPALLEALGADDGDVRWAAGNIVLRMPATERLIGALRELVAHGSALQRKMATYCLRDLNAPSPAVENTVRAALNDTDRGVRLAAMSALARLAIDRPTAARDLIRMLNDEDVSVRRVAAAVLGLLGERSEAVRSALEVAANSDDPSLQRAAVRSLRLLSI